MAFGYPIDFDVVSTAATEAARLNTMLKRLQKENRFSIHVDGINPALHFNSESKYGYQTSLRKTIEEWLMNQIAKQTCIIEQELAKRE